MIDAVKSGYSQIRKLPTESDSEPFASCTEPATFSKEAYLTALKIMMSCSDLRSSNGTYETYQLKGYDALQSGKHPLMCILRNTHV